MIAGREQVVRPPPPAHRVLDARRRGPHRRRRGHRRGRRPARGRHHRPREHVRRPRLLPRRARRRPHARHRHRGLHGHHEPVTTGRVATSTTSTTSRCSPSRPQGYRNLIKVVVVRVPRRLLPEAARRLRAARAAPRGSRRHHRVPRRRGVTGAARATTTPARASSSTASSRCSGATRSSSSCRTTGCPSSAHVNPQLIQLARDLRAPLLATNDSHYTHRDDAESHAALLCVQTGAHARRPEALQVRRRRVLPEDRGGDARPVRRLRGGVRQHAAHRRARQRRDRVRQQRSCRRSPTPAGPRRELVPPRAHASRAPRSATGSRRRPRGARADRVTSSASSSRWASPPTSSSCGTSCRYARSRGIRVGPGPGERGGVVRRVLPAHRRHRPDPLRPAVRALAEPGPQADARHRHGLRLPLPRRDDQVRVRALRLGPRRADRHLLHHQGAGRGARLGARARVPVRWSATRSPSSCRRSIMGRDTPLRACLETVAGPRGRLQDGGRAARALRSRPRRQARDRRRPRASRACAARTASTPPRS